jgi:WD40 repeat protein
MLLIFFFGLAMMPASSMIEVKLLRCQEPNPSLVEGKLVSPPNPFTAESPFRVVSLSPSGRFVAGFNGTGELHVWDRLSGKSIFVDKQSHALGISQILFLDSDTFVTAGLDGRVLVFHLNTSDKSKPEEWTIWAPKERGGVLYPTFLAVTEQGLLLARCRQVVLLDKRSGAVIRKYDMPKAGALVQDSPFSAFAASLDGRRFYTGAENILEWDIALGSPTTTCGSKGKSIGALALSPDGRKLLSAVEGVGVEEWDLASKKSRSFAIPDEWINSRVVALSYGSLQGQAFALLGLGAVLEFHEGNLKEWHRLADRKIDHGAFFPSEKLLVAGEAETTLSRAAAPESRNRIVVWDISKACDTSSGPIYRLFPTKSGRQVLAVTSECVRLYSLSTAEEIPVQLPDGVRPNSQLIHSTVINAAGSHLFLGMKRGSIAKWNISEKRIEVELGVRKPPEVTALSEDESLLVSGCGRTIDLLDARSGGDRGSITLKGAEVTSLALGRTGTVMAVGTADESGSIATFWDARKRDTLFRSPLEGGTPSFKFDSSEKVVWAVDGSPTLYRWQLDNGQLRRISVGKPLQALCPTSESRVLVASGNILFVIDADSGKLVEKYDSHKDVILDIVIAQEQRTVLTASRDGAIRSWLLKAH